MRDLSVCLAPEIIFFLQNLPAPDHRSALLKARPPGSGRLPSVLNWGGNCAREKVASVPASQPLRDHQGTEISPRCLLSESPTAYACWIHSALPLSKCVCHLPAAGTRRSQHLWTLTGALLQGGWSEKGRGMTPGLRLPFNLWIGAAHYSHIITFSFFKPSLFCQTLVFICNLDWVWFVISLFYSFSDR